MFARMILAGIKNILTRYTRIQNLGRDKTMREIETEVKTYAVHVVCPKCDKSTMVAHECRPMLLSNPPKFAHICKNIDCGHEEYFTIRYPYHRLKEIVT